MEPVYPTELPEAIASILGFFAPIVIQLVTKNVKQEMARFWIALALCVIVGFAAIVVSGVPLTYTPQFMAILFTFSSIAYKTIWKPIIFNKTKLAAPPTTY